MLRRRETEGEIERYRERQRETEIKKEIIMIITMDKNNKKKIDTMT